MQFEMLFTFVPPVGVSSASPTIAGSPQAGVIWPLGPSITPITGSTAGVSYIRRVLGDPSPSQTQSGNMAEPLPQVIGRAPSPSPPPPAATKRKPVRQKGSPKSKVLPLISCAPEPPSGEPSRDTVTTTNTINTTTQAPASGHPCARSPTPPLPPPLVFSDLPNPGSGPPVQKLNPGPKKRAPKRKVPPAIDLAPDPDVVVENPLFRDCSVEPDLDEVQGRRKRSRLSEETMAKIRTQSFYKLRSTVAKDPEYERLSIADKLKLDKAYREYQIAVYLIAIENKLQIKPVLEYLGNNTRIRGPTMYNNFCSYDPVAGPIHRDSNIPVNDRAIQCGELWDKLTEDEQLQWKDPDYLDSLVSQVDSASDSVDPVASAIPKETASRRKLPKDKFELSKWVRKVRRDLKNLSTSHQMEGYLVLASCDPVRPFLRTTGSILANEFLDILAADTNQCNSFFQFVSGKQAIKDVSGQWPPVIKSGKRRVGIDNDDPNCPHDMGSKKANIAEVRMKLRNALRRATNGVWQGGWPGTKTAAKLRKLGVTLSIAQNDKAITPADFCRRPSDMLVGQTQRILTAFANGWVKLTGPPVPDASPVGGLSSSEETDEDDDETDSQMGIRPKKPLPRSKKITSQKKAAAKPKTPTQPVTKKAAPKARTKRKLPFAEGLSLSQIHRLLTSLTFPSPSWAICFRLWTVALLTTRSLLYAHGVRLCQTTPQTDLASLLFLSLTNSHHQLLVEVTSGRLRPSLINNHTKGLHTNPTIALPHAHQSLLSVVALRIVPLN
ncbi:hypothetical protein Pst134EA_002937 [Puccinia striiformis f. sp. tritici]|uniref:hypothetical protein n=1 Tax=Puccinia striiformis f. sp. tritici TaxID=168172 RepID=UPI002008C4C6|nr:hypothetical protein Pst134EA_002937 [Puccinia striiformis f. sp. tritici]KAH9472315.1 hypothetical protein Pst134EA_002937 [Puccinia striiformis f. sp. tritici]